MPAIASTGSDSPARRIDEADLADAALIGADEHAGDERREVRVVGLHPALLDRRGAHRHREQPLGRPVHERRRAARVGDDDRIRDRVDDEIQAIAFRARLHLGDPQAAVVLLDLLARPPQVGDVAQDRDDAAALAWILGDGAEQLEHQVRSVDGIDEEQLAARRTRFLNRLARQRRRQQHVVHADGAAAAFAFLFRGGEQGQRAGVGDEQPAFGVGQENRIRHGVDDVVEQGALAPLPAIAFEQRLMPQHLRQLLREERGEPPQLLRQPAGAANQQQSERVVTDLGGVERHDVKRRVLEGRRGAASAVGGGVNGAKEGRFAIVERGDERVVPVVERHGETRGGRPGKPLRAHGEERLLAGRLQQADRREEAKNLTKPLQRVLRTVGHLAPADEGFEQTHPGREQLVVDDGHEPPAPLARAPADPLPLGAGWRATPAASNPRPWQRQS